MEDTTKGAAVMGLVTVENKGAWRWMVAACLAAVLSLTGLLAAQGGVSTGAGAGKEGSQASGPLASLAAEHPDRQVEVIVQLRPGFDLATGEDLVSSAG